MKFLINSLNKNEAYEVTYNSLDAQNDSQEIIGEQGDNESSVSFIDRLTKPNWESFGKSFEYMGKGMLGIFVVITILVIGISILNKATSPKKDTNQTEDNEN